MQPVYMMTKNCKHRDRQCGKCHIAVRRNKKYVLDPSKSADDGLPVVYHAACWQQLQQRR